MKTFKIELWDIDKVKPYSKNAKLHPDDQIERLAKQIKLSGWDQPIVVDADGVIIKGHGRRLAAIKLGYSKVPVIHRDDMTKEEADAARIGDNSVSSTAYDTKMLQDELQRIMASTDLTFELDDIGLTDKEKSLLLDDLAIPELTSVMEDTHEEISRQKAADEDRISASDRNETPIAKAFGFKTITNEQTRIFNAFLAAAEAAIGKEGREAFFERLKECI